MTIAATYFQCREDGLYYPDPVWYGEHFTVMMDEDGCFIWVTPGTDPETVLSHLEIPVTGQLTKCYPAKRMFREVDGQMVFKDSITFRFTINGQIPKSDSKKKGRTQEWLTNGGKKRGKRNQKS